MSHFKHLLQILLISTCINFNFLILHSALAHEAAKKNYLVVFDAPAQKHSRTTLTLIQARSNDMQKSALARMRKQMPELNVKKRFNTLINAVEMELNDAQMAQISKMPGVKKVYPVRMRYAHLDASHQIVKSVEAWTALGGQSEAGKGIKIAVIDSGIRPENPMFSDAGFTPPELSQNTWLRDNPDYCRKAGGNPGFCNNKIIIARVSEPSDDLLLPISEEQLTPLDTNRHGSHVAGIAAGNPVSINYEGVDVTLSGAAPGAYLMVYKALFNNGGLVSGSDTMLLEALEHAVNDGADVINNSWGAIQDGSPEDSVFAQVFKAAEELGIVVVSSAGNNGNLDLGLNCPGCIEAGITVANSAHGRVFGHKLVVGELEMLASTGNETQTFDSITLGLDSIKSAGDDRVDQCAPFPPDFFLGKAVIVEYSNRCLLETLVTNIADASGEAVLLHESNEFSSGGFRPFTQFSGEFDIPVLGLVKKDAEALELLAAETDQHISISGTREALTNVHAYNQLNPSSSKGPNSDPNVLKPDITAPGTDVLSAGAPEPTIIFPPFVQPTELPHSSVEDPVFVMLSGTSMSSPIVAGAAALIRQAFPDWSAVQIKTALTSTASPTVNYGESIATPLQQGAGQLNIFKALKTPLTFAKSSHAHGACVAACQFSNTVTNVSESAATWSIDISLSEPNATYFLDEQEVALGAQGSSTASQAFNFGIDTSNVENGKWVFGEAVFSSGAEVTNRLPIAVYANDNSDSRIINTNLAEQQNNTLNAVARVRNLDFVRDPELVVSVPEYASIQANSVNTTVNNGLTTSVDVSADGKLVWKGQLQSGEITLQSTAPWQLGSLKTAGFAPLNCSEGCTQFYEYIEFPFEFFNRSYPGVTLTSNGFVVAGLVELGPFDFNQAFQLPSDDNLNNIIAPFWAEFDLRDPNLPDDTGSGAMYVATVEYNSEQYLVIEWNDVKRFGQDIFDERAYTFQVIFKQNSDQILFNYLNIADTSNAFIGAENHDATLGLTYYNGNTGNELPTPIVDAYTLELVSKAAGTVDIEYVVVLPESQVNTQSDVADVSEDEEKRITVLQNDSEPVDFVVDVELKAQQHPIHTRRLLKLTSAAIDSTTLSLVEQPQFGTATVMQGAIQYKPNDNYFGPDSFTYQVANLAGGQSDETTVNIVVGAVNDSPMINDISPIEVREEVSVHIVAEGQDVEGDTLTWAWEQVSGPNVNFTQSDNSITFTAPKVANDQLIQFEVTTSDGALTSEVKTANVTVKNRSGGSVSILFLLALASIITIYRTGERRIYT